MDRPFGLLAELTYRCPLACPYCSNPLNLADYGDELTTAEWRRVLAEAYELGVLQLHLSEGPWRQAATVPRSERSTYCMIPPLR